MRGGFKAASEGISMTLRDARCASRLHRMTRVAFVTPWPLDDPNAWSGVIQPMLHSLESHADVLPVSTSLIRDALPDRATARLLDGRGGRRYLVGHALATARKRAHRLEPELQRVRPDVVLAVAASQDIAFLKGAWPVVQVSDLTFAQAQQMYPDCQHLHPISRWQGARMARRSARRVHATLAATHWAREVLVADDGMVPESVHVAPFGPGIPPPHQRAHFPGRGPVRILSVISNWKRKGGDRVLAIHEELIRRGLPHELTVVGVTDPLPSSVRSVGRVSRERMQELLGTHHLLLEPARANASGITLTDALNAGLPAVATRTGGVDTIVVDGITGVLIPNAEGRALATPAAEAIEQVVQTWAEMSSAARTHAQMHLTWERWAETATRVLREAAG